MSSRRLLQGFGTTDNEPYFLSKFKKGQSGPTEANKASYFKKGSSGSIEHKAQGAHSDKAKSSLDRLSLFSSSIGSFRGKSTELSSNEHVQALPTEVELDENHIELNKVVHGMTLIGEDKDESDSEDEDGLLLELEDGMTSDEEEELEVDKSMSSKVKAMLPEGIIRARSTEGPVLDHGMCISFMSTIRASLHI